jgi:2,4-dienoyl-CoA reductase-like NADH-dependent reductase (Old Yellow Enzyme family)
MGSPALFSPLTLRSVTFRNRIGVSPMCQYSSLDGQVAEWHIVHYGTRAVGGAGLTIVEATGVVPQGRISPGDLGIWSDEHIPGLLRLTKFLDEQGSVPAIQLAHAGRKASTPAPLRGGKFLGVHEGGWEIVAPSPIPFAEGHGIPHEMSKPEIQLVVSRFADAARRAWEAGFKAVEVHAAHGYLAHQFLSPLTNRRTDEYGGSFENRTRFLREVVGAVRKSWPDALPLFVRISVTDWAEGGWNIEESAALCRELKQLGVDLIDASSGGLVPDAKIPVGPGYQVPFAARLRKETGLATAAVGLIRSPEEADEVVKSGAADFVLLGRELLRNPYWPQAAAKKLGAAPLHPPQYKRAAD